MITAGKLPPAMSAASIGGTTGVDSRLQVSATPYYRYIEIVPGLGARADRFGRAGDEQ